MAIYRGAGGAGDATGDSASEALLVRELAAEVTADAAAAEAARVAAVAAKVAAETAETNAETAETNAETAETNAETAQAAAASSASAAATSATNAANSATAAQTAETNAETAETNAETAETNAAASASAASTSATNASNSASAAATSATNASNSASAASTSATNASNSASAASTSATNAASSATAASGSATSAASSASTATTQAGLASTSASNAATSESNAASSASAAATSASNAATSATNASNSASAASTSASNASTSEIAAAASAAAAAASYDSFDDRYLGAKSAAPTLDNDGNALITGALYYNNGTVTPADKGMYVYDGTQWIAASAASTAILTVFKFTATGGQTTFSGTGDTGVSLSYTAGSVLVTLNGVLLEIPSEVTASSGTSVVLASGAVAGDELNVYAFSTFDIANTYTQAQVDAGFVATTGNQTVAGIKTFSSLGVFAKGSTNGITIGDVTTNSNSVLRLQGTSAGKNFQIANNLNVGGLEFTPSTADGGTTYTTPAMVLTSAGNVGIGTSSPGSALHVQRPNGTATYLQLFQTSLESWQIGMPGGTAALTFRNSGTEQMRLDTSGNLMVGTTSQFGNGVLNINTYRGGAVTGLMTQPSTNANYDAAGFRNSSGSYVGYISCTASATSYVTSSDYRLKDNIAPMTGALAKVSQLKPCTYTWKSTGEQAQGFIAHELAEVVPDCVTGEKDAVETYTDEEGVEQTRPKYQGIDTSFLVATLTAAIQELKAEVDSLKSEVTALKGQA